MSGLDGHGSAYYILASHVKVRAKDLLGFDFDLGAPTVELTADLQDIGTFPSAAHRKMCHPNWQAEMLVFCRAAAIEKGVELD